MKDVTKITISFIFLFVLALPLAIMFYNAYGVIASVLLVLIPLAWFVLDSELSHFEMDQYM